MFPSSKKGKTIADYAQGQDEGLRNLPATGSGACIGFAVRWLTAKRSSTSVWDGNRLDGNEKAEIIRLQRSELSAVRYRETLCKARPELRGMHLDWYSKELYDGRLKPYGDHGRVTGGDTRDVRRLAARLETAPSPPARHRYKLLILRRSQGGGHACAAVVGSEAISYLDPNCGEILFTTRASFSSWFVEYFDVKGFLHRQNSREVLSSLRELYPSYSLEEYVAR